MAKIITYEVQFRTWDVVTIVVQAMDADEAIKDAEERLLDQFLRPNEEYETLDILELKGLDDYDDTDR